MVTKIAIYIEGGGEKSSTQDPFRKGMSDFLSDIRGVARQLRAKWQVVACGGRQQAYHGFCDALVNDPTAYNVLLVDAEELPESIEEPWPHLKKRKGDNWEQPNGATEKHCFLMVVTMEAWLFSDRDAIKVHFGKHFDPSALPELEYLEKTPESALYQAIAKAIRACPARHNKKSRDFEKIHDCATLLSKVKASVVRKHSASCERLFSELGRVLGKSM